MYWLALFAIIMELVFRVREYQTKSTETKSQNVVNKNGRLRYADYEQNNYQNNWPYYEYLESETSLTDDRYYRIKNEKDNLFLTMTAVEVKDCILRVININGTVDTKDPAMYTVYLDPQNRAYISQLWQVETRGQTIYLVPANIINLAPSNEQRQRDIVKWMAGRNNRRWRNRNNYYNNFLSPPTTPLPPLKKSAVELLLQDSNDYQDTNWNVDLNTLSSSSTAAPAPVAGISKTNILDDSNGDDYSVGNEDDDQNDLSQNPDIQTKTNNKNDSKNKSIGDSQDYNEDDDDGGGDGDGGTTNNQDSGAGYDSDIDDDALLTMTLDVDDKSGVQKRAANSPPPSPSSCSRNATKMIWKLKWRLVKTSSVHNLKHAHFEIRGPNRTCIIFNGFIGDCGQLESSWTFYSIQMKFRKTNGSKKPQ